MRQDTNRDMIGHDTIGWEVQWNDILHILVKPTDVHVPQWTVVAVDHHFTAGMKRLLKRERTTYISIESGVGVETIEIVPAKVSADFAW